MFGLIKFGTLVFVAFAGLSFQVSRAQQAPTEESLVSETPPPLEFRQLHPDARKLIVDEIRLELQAENEKRFAGLSTQAESWLRIVSGALAVFGALLALLGWRGLSGLRQNIKNDLLEFVRNDSVFQNEVTTKLGSLANSAASQTLERGRREISLARLDFLSRKIAEASSYTDQDRYAMIDLVRSVKDDPELIQTASFEGSVYSVLLSFYRADLDVSIDDLEAELGDYFGRRPQLAGVLVDSYGERMLESTRPDIQLTSRFEQYVLACRQLKVFQFAAPYVLVLAHDRRPAGWQKTIEQALKELRYMDDDQKERAAGAIKRAAQRSPDEITTYRQERETEVMASFLSEYGAQLDKACEPKSA